MLIFWIPCKCFLGEWKLNLLISGYCGPLSTKTFNWQRHTPRKFLPIQKMGFKGFCNKEYSQELFPPILLIFTCPNFTHEFLLSTYPLGLWGCACKIEHNFQYLLLLWSTFSNKYFNKQYSWTSHYSHVSIKSDHFFNIPNVSQSSHCTITGTSCKWPALVNDHKCLTFWVFAYDEVELYFFKITYVMIKMIVSIPKFTDWSSSF